MKKEINKKQKTLNPPRAILAGLFLLIFFLGWFLGHQDYSFSSVGFTPKLTGKDSNNKSVDFSQFWKAWDTVEKEFDGKLDYQKMVEGAIRGMVESLGDPFTAYMTPEESKELENDLSGTISGIGAEIGIKSNKVTIISPVDDSPAKKAGIVAGDTILRINDESTEGMSVYDAVKKIRGDAGTKVNLTILRGGQEKKFEITRAQFTVKSVKSEIKNGNVGYLEISRFDENTAELVRSALESFTSKGIKRIVLDLRDNPGGYLDSSVDIASEFIEKGVIVSEKKDSVNGKKEDYKANGRGKATSGDIKIVVLVNQGSASASEIVAGALKDYKRATLVGEKTFGKGSVQTIENLGAGSKLRITIAHWYTPLGKNISRDGIEPDIEIKMTDEDYNASRDPQLNKALELFR